MSGDLVQARSLIARFCGPFGIEAQEKYEHYKSLAITWIYHFLIAHENISDMAMDFLQFIS